jgi:succinate dehydrogenase/fumarate reductase cytochrome b subunit
MPSSRRLDEHFLRGIRSSTATNAEAYGFSLVVAGSFAALDKVRGEPSWLELFLFLAGACLGFALVNTLSTLFFRKESPDEPELVISLATSLSVFSVCASVGAATGVAYALGGWPAWPLASLVFTLVYVSGVGAEIGFAASRHPSGGTDR